MWDKNYQNKHKKWAHTETQTHRNMESVFCWATTTGPESYPGVWLFPSRYQLQITYWKGMELGVNFSVLKFWVVLSYENHLHAVPVSVSSYVYYPCCIWKLLFPSIHRQPLLLQSLHSLFCTHSEALWEAVWQRHPFGDWRLHMLLHHDFLTDFSPTVWINLSEKDWLIYGCNNMSSGTIFLLFFSSNDIIVVEFPQVTQII